jgi:hypothetical protein
VGTWRSRKTKKGSHIFHLLLDIFSGNETPELARHAIRTSVDSRGGDLNIEKGGWEGNMITPFTSIL